MRDLTPGFLLQAVSFFLRLTSTMEKFMQGFIRACTFVVALGGAGVAQAVDITGAGATFPYPIYSKWAEIYKAKTGSGLNYQSIGSGGGIKQIKSKTVDFGASDMPLKAEDLEKDGLVQFPAVIGGVVPVVNLEGVAPGQMKMTGTLLADIYMGKVKKWNDPAIAALNAGVRLPDENITVVRRADGDARLDEGELVGVLIDVGRIDGE